MDVEHRDAKRVARPYQTENDMRRTLFAGLAVVAAVTTFNIPTIQTADAQVSSGRNPYCLRRNSGTWDCTYRSFQQCNVSSRTGMDGMCVQNPEYRGGPRTQRQQPQGTWGSGWGGNRW
jgi:hypothetical protein